MVLKELLGFGEAVTDRYRRFYAVTAEFDAAPTEVESDQHSDDAYAEALFLRAFTAYENDLERLFLHYATGGATLQGKVANTYLKIKDEQLARKLTRAGFKFLSWAKPQDTRVTAENYLENGWPISEMMNANSQALSDCERIRNRIAHNSLEAASNFNAVQRNMIQTERLFAITPGQFLRIRNRRLKKLHIDYYLNVMESTIAAILDPPP